MIDRSNPAGNITLLALTLFLLTILGCTGYRPTVKIEKPTADFSPCLAIYPGLPWSAVHRIEGSFQGGRVVSLMGVTKIDKEGRRLEVVLVTVEGLVIFEASRDAYGQTSVKRALAPFDRPGFAEGLLADVESVFRPPGDQPYESGLAADGSQVCRFKRPDWGIVEQFFPPTSQGVKIVFHDPQGRLAREIEIKGPFSQGLAKEIILHAHIPAEYRLTITLLEVNP